MKFFRFILVFLLIFSLSCPLFADDELEKVDSSINVNSVVSDGFPKINSRHVIVYERNSKTVLYEKSSSEKCKMASTTKIMTCILILEKCDLKSSVSISSKSANTGGSRLGLHTNDVISVNDLLYGLMLCSGNDAAVALAEYCGGSIEGFAELMNSKANELGLSSTHFVTPHGLDNENHYTTAYDFAILTDFALNNPQFIKIVGTKSCTIKINNKDKKISNTNELLGSVPNVYGVKTGYTSQAGRCLISAIKQNNLDVIIIVFGADTKNIRTQDSVKLIKYIFANYEAIDLSSLIKEKYSNFQNFVLPYISIEKASSAITTKLDQIKYTFYPVNKADLNSISLITTEEKLVVPISENQKIAEINLYINNKKICSTNILSNAYIARKSSLEYFLYFIINYKNFYQI